MSDSSDSFPKVLDPDRVRPRHVSTWLAPSLPTVLFLLLGLAFLVFLATRFDVDLTAIWSHITDSNPALYALAFVLYYFSFVIRGMRWRIILQNVASRHDGTRPVPSVLECTQYVLLARFTDSIAWLRVGNLYRAYLASDRSSGSYPRTVGTLVAEHFLDMLVVLAALLVVSAYMVARNGTAHLPQVIAAAVIVTGLVALALVLMKRYGLRLAQRLPPRLAGTYGHFHQGTLSGFSRLPLITVLSVAVWLCAVGRWYFVIAALGVPLSVPVLLLVTLVNAVLAAVPLTPGGLGLVEPGVTGVLLLSLVPEQAVSVALVERSISYVSLVVLGGLLLIGRRVNVGWRRPARG